MKKILTYKCFSLNIADGCLHTYFSTEAATGGHFVCRACNTPLYSAKAKFDSGCGWPAFDKCYKGAIDTKTDSSFGMRRVEILCATCGGHLGHVFEGERMTSTNERHCVNSVSSLLFFLNPLAILSAK